MIKRLPKKLGVAMKRESDAMALAKEINASIKPSKKLTLDEIVQETRAVRR